MSVERTSNKKSTTTTITTTTTTSPSLNDSSSKQLNMAATTSTSTTSNYPLGISFSANIAHMNERPHSDDIAYMEKRTAHNALERQRREGLNTKFQELAHVLPALQQIRRPSKSMIVAKSLEFVSSAGERETDFQGQIHALRKENEQLMRQASLSKRRIKKRIDQDGVDQRKSPCSNSKQSKQPTTEVINRSRKRNRSIDVVQPQPSICANIRKTSLSSDSQQQQPKVLGNRKRRKQSRATFETCPQQQQQQQQHSHQQQLMSTPAYRQQMAADGDAGTSLDQQAILNYSPPPQQQQQTIVSSQRPRFNSHQPTTGQLQISPAVSRHNSLTLNDQFTSLFDFDNTPPPPPHEFSIAQSSPFGNEQVFFNTFENMVNTIPVSSHGQNNAAASSSTYEIILESIMQNQDPTTSDNQFYQWH